MSKFSYYLKYISQYSKLINSYIDIYIIVMLLSKIEGELLEIQITLTVM